MSLISAIGGLFDETGRARAHQAGDALANDLALNSPYHQAGQLTGDQGIIDGTAQLGATQIGYNPSNLDADTNAIGALGTTFGDIAKNGGQLTNAVLDQARSDLANTGIRQLNQASRQQAGQVLAQDSAERNWAANNKNQTRAQQLAAQLQKQLWNTAVSHANFQTALAAQALRNQDRNTAFDLANNIATAGQNASNTDQTLTRAFQQQTFSNAMSGLQAIGSALGGGLSVATDALGAQAQAPSSTTSGAVSSAAPTYSDGYAAPGVSTGYSSVASKLAAPVNSPAGMTEPGNVDLSNRGIVYNDDGTYSTVRSMTFKDGNDYVVVPSAFGGSLHTPRQAFEQYKLTGQHMGKFKTQQAADAYAESIHDDQATQYKPQQSGFNGVMGPMPDGNTIDQYVNPVTGNTVNLNMPTDSSAWGDWLTAGSTIASV